MKTALFLLLVFISSLIHGQTRTEKKEIGPYTYVTTYTKVASNKETIEEAEYITGKNHVLARIKYVLVNGKKEGEENRITSPNTLVYTATYAKGVLHGPYRNFHSNGKVEYQYTYVNGRKEGEVNFYYSDGKVRSTGRYMNDEQEGEWKTYHENEKLYSTGLYKNGRREGEWRGYNQDGTLQYVKKYTNGTEDVSFKTTEKTSNCMNERKMRAMCMFISGKEKVSKPVGRFKWLYQIKLFEIACIDPTKESEEEIGKKVAAMMKDYEDQFICNNTQFDVSNGNLIKFAINLKFDEFLDDMVRWKVDLNKVDKLDGRTVLDYLKDKINDSKGLATEPILKQYYINLREAGGKHRSEL